MKKILDYEEMNELLDNLNSNIIREVEPIGYSAFEQPIRHFIYGTGKEHVILTAGIHASELITNIFLLTFMKKLSDGEIVIDSNKYTIHFIPIENPDGTIITTSAIRALISKNSSELYEQLICIEYYMNSRLDDYNAENFNDKEDKLIYNMFKYIDINVIDEKYANLKMNIKNIIENSNLPKGILINWTSNGNGIDLNSNIECGEYLNEFLSKKEHYSKLRLNQINLFERGPIGCPSIKKEFVEEIENTHMLNFYKKLMSENDVIGSIMYHSCGGSVHYLDYMKEKNYWNESYGYKEINYNRNVAKTYAENCNYSLYSPKTYTTFCSKIRSILPGTLIVELSKLRSNPLSQFIDIDAAEYKETKGELKNLSKSFTNTINDNINALIKTIYTMSEEYSKYKYGILVNKENKCPKDLKFEMIDSKSTYDNDRLVEKETFCKWKEFQKEALKYGFEIEIESSYRSKEYQLKVFEEIKQEKGIDYANKNVAYAGYSEHQTGLAIDICLRKDEKFLCDNELLSTKLPEFILNNSYKFGFIVRYPKDKIEITGYSYEPWHIRYVGLNLARELYENNLTLEEWHNLIKETK